MDVIILGGGIVGLTMANLLAKDPNITITIIEANKPVLDWDPSGYDLRCSAITRATQNIFTHLQIWSDITCERVAMYDKMLVWDKNESAKINFAANEIFSENLGHIVENRVMQRVLWRKALSTPAIQIVAGSPHKLEQQEKFTRLYIDGYHMDARLVIGADGAESWLRKTANIPVHTWEHRQSSLVATINSELAHHNTAMQRFAPDGPLAFLPLTQPNLSSIVWTSTPDKIQQLLSMDAQKFCLQLSEEFSHKLGNLQLQGGRAAFPLRMLHARNYIAARIALIGDAVHVVHPLAGQGLNLGILDAAALAEVVLHAASLGNDFGQHTILRKYERWRKGHNIATLAMVEGFKRAFATTLPTITALRSLGVNAVNDLSLAKNAMISFAMGLSGDLPASAK